MISRVNFSGYEPMIRLIKEFYKVLTSNPNRSAGLSKYFLSK